MRDVIIAALISLVVSVIYNRFSAAHTFEVIDGYVEGMMEKNKELIEYTCKLIRDTYCDK